MPRPVTAAVSALLLLLLAGCGGGDQQATEASGSPSAATSDTSTPADEPTGRQQVDKQPAEVPETLQFAGTTVDGESFDGASLAGKPTLLWFWAPWCPTCRSQIPQVEGLAAEHGSDLNVVGIGSLDSAEAIAGFAADVEGVTHLEDTEGELWQRFGIAEQSSFVLLDSDGSVAFEAGYGGSEELGDRVEAVLG